MAELDLTRLAFVATHKREELGLSCEQLARMTGCSKRQISYLQNGKPVNAAATMILAETLKIDLLDMLPKNLRVLMQKVRELHEEEQNQGVTPCVTRETFPKLGGMNDLP